MKPKTIMLLAVAGVCGLVSLLGFQAMQTGQKAPKVEKARVLVVVDEIGAGSALNQDNVTFREIPVSSLPKDPVLNEAQYKDRSALIPMMAGDIVRMSKLTEPGVSGASSQIPKGWRVTTISVNDNHTNSGMLRPGDRVDVLVTYKTSAGRATSTKTKTLLEYVEIFATDNQTASKADNETKKVKNVSLLLTPEQVNYVLLAASKGNLSLSWRHRMDDELVQVGDIDDALLEELEGTVGIYEDRPLYDHMSDEETLSHPTQNVAVEPAAPQTNSPANFLSSVSQQPVAPPMAGTIDSQPLWTMHVYNGSAPEIQQFTIPVEATTELGMSPEQGSSFSAGLKALFGGPKASFPANN
ncbi:MAG: Flp pilus assembly protein CpaB [Planctomycetaceae bacterium]|nr:Flp pilus assembly protein CpaB [Planctomycetaceae bacterium]